MRHKAKIDWWIAAAIIAGLVLPWVTALTSSRRWLYALPVAVWVLVFGFCYPQSYETTPEALVIRAGLSRRAIPYIEITAVRPTSDTRSSLALSLDRVRIEATSGDLLISPADQDAFLADLAARAPHLTRRGQDLVVLLG